MKGAKTMRTMFGMTTASMSSSKASSCCNASFDYAQVNALSTILVVLLLMLIISIIPIIRSEILIIMLGAIGYKSKPKLVLNN